MTDETKPTPAPGAPATRSTKKYAPTKPYRFKGPGQHWIEGADGATPKKVDPGTVVELTENQAKAFGDQFEPVG